MTDDMLLRDALLDAAAEEFATELGDTTPVDASPRLRRQMTAMLNDPDGWAKRARRGAMRRLARTAAMIALACALSAAALMAASPTIRAGLINWAVEATASGVFYHFSGADSPDSYTPLPRYEIADFPEGYELYIDENEWMGGYNSYYIKTGGAGGYICFDYMRMEQGGGLGLYGEDSYAASDVEINGMPGKLYQLDDKEDDWAVVWIDEQANLLFGISASLGSDEVLRMAESVSLCES